MLTQARELGGIQSSYEHRCELARRSRAYRCSCGVSHNQIAVTGADGRLEGLLPVRAGHGKRGTRGREVTRIDGTPGGRENGDHGRATAGGRGREEGKGGDSRATAGGRGREGGSESRATAGETAATIGRGGTRGGGEEDEQSRDDARGPRHEPHVTSRSAGEGSGDTQAPAENLLQPPTPGRGRGVAAVASASIPCAFPPPLILVAALAAVLLIPGLVNALFPDPPVAFNDEPDILWRLFNGLVSGFAAG